MQETGSESKTFAGECEKQAPSPRSPGAVGGAGAALIVGTYFFLLLFAGMLVTLGGAVFGGAVPKVAFLSITLLVANVGTTAVAVWGSRRPVHRMLPMRGITPMLAGALVVVLVGLWPFIFAGASLLTRVWPISDVMMAAFAPFQEAPWIGLLVIGFLVPIAEEALFRGALLGVLLERYSARWAVPVSALIFGLVHLSQQFVGALALGLVMGWLRVRTRSLWPGLVLHMLNNTAVAVLFFLDEATLAAWGLDPMAAVVPMPPVWSLLAGGVLLVSGLVAAHRLTR